MPFKRRGVVPFEALDLEGGAGVALQRLGSAKGTDRSGEIVVPGAGVGIVFLFVERVIGAQLQPFPGAEQGDAVDLAAGVGDVFLVPPADAAEEIQLPLARITGIWVLAPLRVIAGAIKAGVLDRNCVGVGL